MSSARSMDLILWRHAEAFELREETDDLARALTAKGERQAQRMPANAIQVIRSANSNTP